jgi:uncharacterized membrane protein YgaE (UPF0421/DUF939 family)
MASYLGRNVNLALLVIIIGVIVALVGTTVFFQRSLQNRTQEFETTTGTLAECQVALANYQDKFTQATQQVNKTAQDIRKYDQLYEQRTGELKDTQLQLENIQRQSIVERQRGDRLQDLYNQEIQLNTQLNMTISSLNQKLSSTESKLRTACSQCRSSGGDCDIC